MRLFHPHIVASSGDDVEVFRCDLFLAVRLLLRQLREREVARTKDALLGRISL